MLRCSIWFPVPSFWIGGGLESGCVRCGWCRVVARHHPHRTHDLRSGSEDHHPIQKLGAENRMLQLNI